VADLRRVSPSIVAVHARPELLDALAPAEAIVHRVAADEAMVIGASEDAAALVRTLGRTVASDEGAVVLDDTDGWAALEIRGPDARVAFSRVSPLALPDAGTVQGDVLRVPARVAASGDEVIVLVPAAYGTWVDRKIRERCPEVARAPAEVRA
jgi:glycine cleavage system aminomethyltransferase T